nr:EpsG family protein [uncultured Devosia sp.]
MSFNALFAQAYLGAIYLALYATVAVLAMLKRPVSQLDWLWIPFTVLLVIFVGFRHEVGADWADYATMVNEAGARAFPAVFLMRDPAYQLLNWLGSNVGGGVYVPNVVCAILAVVPLLLFCRTRSNPALSLLAAVPYLIIVVFLGYTRQSAAIGLCILSILSLEREKFWSAAIFSIVASVFHYTAAGFFLPVAIICLLNYKKIGILRCVSIIVVSSAILAIILIFSSGLWEKINTYIFDPTGISERTNNLDDIFSQGRSNSLASSPALNSAGSIPRNALNVIFSVGFLLLLYNKSKIIRRDYIWVLLSLSSFILFPASFFLSTFSDRIGLFFIPLQMHAVSAIDGSLADRYQPFYKAFVALSYGSVLVIWLFLSSYSNYWMPYDNLFFSLFL